MSDGGKGSSPRPFSVSNDEFGNRHETIFGVKPPKVPYVYVPPTPQELDDAKAEDEAFDNINKLS
jgi:hypothetical protein